MEDGSFGVLIIGKKTVPCLSVCLHLLSFCVCLGLSCLDVRDKSRSVCRVDGED